MRMRVHLGGYLTVEQLAREITCLESLSFVVGAAFVLEDAGRRQPEDISYLVRDLAQSLAEGRHRSSMWGFRRTIVVQRGGDSIEFGAIEQLSVVSILHNSPGVQEFEGAARLVRGVFDILKDVIFFHRGKELHDIEVMEKRIILDKRREEVKNIAAERLELIVKVLRDSGVPLEEIQKIILKNAEKIAELDQLHREGLISNIELSDGDVSIESTADQI